MAKGKKGKIKTGIRRRKDANDAGKEKDKVEEDEVKSCSAEPQETITSFIRPEEVQDLVNMLQTNDLNHLPILIGATILGKTDLVKKFLRDGYTLECRDQNGMTPFLWAIRCKNLELIDLYLVKGVKITAEDVNGDNALIHAVKSPTWDEDSVVEFQKNYEKHFDVNYKNKAGNSAFHFSVRRCWIKLCKILIEAGADINGSNKKGVTGLMMAASKGHDSVVTFLLQHNADAFLEDQRGCTALCYAISRSNQKKTEFSSQTITSLLDAFPSREREKYLIRRLQILINPGKRNDSGNIIETFLFPVFSFFVKRVPGGLAMLLKGKVFDIIFQALKNHIGQLDYTVSILGILGEILNYCDCCVNKTNPTVAENDLFRSFLNSQCPKMCIIILKHSGMWNLKNIAHSTFLPLFLVCPMTDSGRKWLQDHYATLQPFYAKYNELSIVKCPPAQGEEAHLKNVRKRIKAFKNLMLKLQNGENIFKAMDLTESIVGFAELEKENSPDKEDSGSSGGVKKIKKKPKIKIAKKTMLEDANAKASDTETSKSTFTATNEGDSNIDQENSKNSASNSHINSNNEINEQEHEETTQAEPIINDHAENDLNITTSEKENNEVKRKFSENEIKSASYDPSDLFGLLATSRSTGSSEESEVENHKENNRILTDSEKEESRLKQVATAMSTILTNPESSSMYAKSSLALKQYLTQKTSDENLEPIKKDLSPALNYLQSLFEDFIAKHRKVWNYEKMNNYPDYKPAKSEDEGMQLMKLKIILTQLESYYLNYLTEEWDLLISVIRNRIWYSEEASNDVISKLQELLLKKETHIVDKLRKIEEEELKSKYLEKKYQQNEAKLSSRVFGDVHLVPEKPLDADACFTVNTYKSDYFKSVENENFTSQGLLTSNPLKKTSSQSKLFDSGKRELAVDLSQGSSGTGLELNTIFFNNCYKSDSYSEIVSIGSKTGSSQSIPTPRNDDERKEHYSLWNKASDNPLEKLFKTVREINEPSLRSSGRFCCWINEINNLKKMIKNSHVQYGEILLPNPLKSGKILLPYGETGYFGSVEMGLDQKGNPMAVKHVKKSFPTSIDILSNIMVRLRKINNKYLLPYYMSEGFEPIIATPLMNFNLGQYILHLKTHCSLDSKAPEIIKEVVAGLHYLHTQKPPIIHGNLKPSNVLIDANGIVKLAEFGISVALYLKKPAPPCSMIWWPGEVITSYIKINKLRSTLAADVATAGMLIHFILSGGQHPFGQQVKEIVDNLIVGKWNLVTTDNDAEDLISWMLVFIPENRPAVSAIVRHIYFWSSEKRWKFLLTCSGACPESGATPHDISQLHVFLDMKAKENNIQGDWKTLILSYFPNSKDSVKNLSSKLTGLLNFLRQCLEDRKRYKMQNSGKSGHFYETPEKLTPRDVFLKTLNSTCGQSHQQQRTVEPGSFLPHNWDLQTFFFNAFPVISLSIYRMLEGTQWMEVPFFAPFNEPYDLP